MEKNGSKIKISLDILSTLILSLSIDRENRFGFLHLKFQHLDLIFLDLKFQHLAKTVFTGIQKGI